jgi:hypothetical protein
MVYRINKEFAKKFGDAKEISLKLQYDLYRKNERGDEDSLRWGTVKDIDGIINILTEFGVLEEIDSEEEDDDDEEDESFHDQLFQSIFFPKIVPVINGINYQNLSDQLYGEILKRHREPKVAVIEDKDRAKETSSDEEFYRNLEKMEASNDFVCVSINKKREYLFFPRICFAENRTADELLRRFLNRIKEDKIKEDTNYVKVVGYKESEEELLEEILKNPYVRDVEKECAENRIKNIKEERRKWLLEQLNIRLELLNHIIKKYS